MADQDAHPAAPTGQGPASDTSTIRALLSILDPPSPDARFVRGLRERLVRAPAPA